jgi:hypothetical protein
MYTHIFIYVSISVYVYIYIYVSVAICSSSEGKMTEKARPARRAHMVPGEAPPAAPEAPWHFFDSHRVEHGPMPQCMMRNWLRQGHFPPGMDLMVRRVGAHIPPGSLNRGFAPIHKLYASEETAFVGDPRPRSASPSSIDPRDRSSRALPRRRTGRQQSSAPAPPPTTGSRPQQSSSSSAAGPEVITYGSVRLTGTAATAAATGSRPQQSSSSSSAAGPEVITYGSVRLTGPAATATWAAPVTALTRFRDGYGHSDGTAMFRTDRDGTDRWVGWTPRQHSAEDRDKAQRDAARLTRNFTRAIIYPSLPSATTADSVGEAEDFVPWSRALFLMTRRTQTPGTTPTAPRVTVVGGASVSSGGGGSAMQSKGGSAMQSKGGQRGRGQLRPLPFIRRS